MRNISLYVDSQKNDGFENDTFTQKVYKGEAADVDPNTTPAVAPDEADSNPDTTPTAAPGEADRIAPEPESGGKGQVWTADDLGEETQDDNQ